MNKKKKRNRIVGLMLCLGMLLVLVLPACMGTTRLQAQNQVIRVGYYQSNNFQEGMSDEEMKEKSLKVLHFIETLVDENKDGIVTTGDVMALLGGAFHLFLKDVKKQLSEERAEKIRTGLVMVVMMA